jgi:uncharacterized protein (DUF2345 family)
MSLKVDAPSQQTLGPGEREVYDYPAEYTKKAAGERLANIRMQEEEAKITTVTGSSDCRAFTSGYRFDLLEYFREDMNNKPYVLVSVNHGATEPVGGSGQESGQSYANSFTCIPFDVPYRPPRLTPKPVVEGAQTAIVDFLEGDPDRPIINGCVYNGMNTIPFGSGIMSGAKSNTSPGGGGYNEFSLNDTAGEEKIIVHGQYDMESTIENDQTLTVHNNRTSTIDVDDSETVGSNQTIKIGADQSETIGANQTVKVGANQSVKVGSSKTETITVAKALSIGAAYQVSVGAAMNESVGALKAEEIGGAKIVGVGAHSSENVAASKSVNAGGNISESAGKNFSCKAGKDVSVSSGKKMSLSAGDDFAVSGKKKGVIDIKDQLVIKCGSASITLKKNGDILIKGKKINIKGSGDVIIKGSKIKEN